MGYERIYMLKCTICGKPLTDKAMDLHHILNLKERKRLKKIRKKGGLCQECVIQLLLLNLITND
jgi:5-methylcytosine-specific restriction endonuclease McrA